MGIVFLFFWERSLGDLMFISSWKFISLNSVYGHKHPIHSKTVYSGQSKGDEYSSDGDKCREVSQQSAILWTGIQTVETISLCDNRATCVLTRSFDLGIYPWIIYRLNSQWNSVLFSNNTFVFHFTSKDEHRHSCETSKTPFWNIYRQNHSKCGFGGTLSLWISGMYQMFRHYLWRLSIPY